MQAELSLIELSIVKCFLSLGKLAIILLLYFCSGLEVDLGGGELYGDFSDNPLLNLTAQLGLETGSYGNVQFVVPWQNKKYSGEEVEQLMVQAGSVSTFYIIF